MPEIVIAGSPEEEVEVALETSSGSADVVEVAMANVANTEEVNDRILVERWQYSRNQVFLVQK